MFKNSSSDTRFWRRSNPNVVSKDCALPNQAGKLLQPGHAEPAPRVEQSAQFQRVVELANATIETASVFEQGATPHGDGVWVTFINKGRVEKRADLGAQVGKLFGRAVDQEGDLLDILVQSRRDRRAAIRFFRKVLKRQGRLPRRLITDKLRSYSAAHRTVMPSVPHSTRQYENNRAEVSHQPTRQRERQMRRFKSIGHAQHFLSVHGLVQNLFRTGRHLLRAVHHRLLRARAFGVWREVTCA